MNYKTRLLLLCTLLAGYYLPVLAQVAGAGKDAQRVAAPYAREESGITNSALVPKEIELRAAIGKQPESPELLYTLALVLRQEGKPRSSLDTYTLAARYRKPATNEIRSVALDYVLLNDYEDAIHWLEIAVRMEPKNVDALYSLGRCYYSKDRYRDAGTMYERVLAIEPTHLKAEENLGLVLDATNHPEEAEEALRKAANWASNDDKDEWPFFDLGSFLLDRDRAIEAFEPLRISVRIKPDCADCHEKLGRALLATHDIPGSIGELEEATRLNPNNPKTHFELGRALRQAGQTERAQQEFAASQKLYSTHSQD